MNSELEESLGARSVGRYVLYDELAAGGMASVHLGRLVGPAGFARTVAIKRLHAQHAKDRDFVAMLLDEARLVVRIKHPNVVPVLDVVDDGDELLLVMELVQGESLSYLARMTKVVGARIPLRIVRAVMVSTLQGLHAAHESMNEIGEPLGIVHRDVSPQNVMVDVDGITRVLDFGIAKAAGRLQTTREGEVKGKAGYMAPEQLDGSDVDRRADIWSATVMLWELVVGDRLFSGDSAAAAMSKVLNAVIVSPRTRVPEVDAAFDAVIMRGLMRDPEKRFSTAREMANAIEDLGDLATSREIGAWVESIAGVRLRERTSRIKEIESATFKHPEKDDAKTSSSRVVARAAETTVVERLASSASQPDIKTDAPIVDFVKAAPVRPAARRAAPVLLLGVVVVASVVGWLALRGGAQDGASPSTVPSLPPSVASIAPSASSASSASPPPPASVAVASATDSAPASSSAARSEQAPPKASVARSAAPPAKRGSCDPPYTLDPRGIRIPKPECL